MPRVDAQRNIDALVRRRRRSSRPTGSTSTCVRSRPAPASAPRRSTGTSRSAPTSSLRSSGEIDDCAAEATRLADSHDPDEALELWLQRYTQFVATKHGLAAALHSGDPAYSTLPTYFHQHLSPALETLLANAEAAGAIRGDVDPHDLLGAVANLCIPPPGSDDHTRPQRMVGLLLDGLRYGARS